MKTKVKLIIALIIISSCMASKRAKPCKQCPHYSKVNAIFLEKVKLNPYPSDITLQTKYDQ